MNENKSYNYITEGADDLNIPYWNNSDYPQRSSLQFATIISENLYDYLRFEGELVPLKILNWKDQIEQNRFDFLLIESCFIDSAGDWEFALYNQGQKQEVVLLLLGSFRRINIPIVFWYTFGPESCEKFSKIVTCSQYVYCSDFASVRKMGEKGVTANLLPPAVQPVLHNPFRLEERADRGYLWNSICDIRTVNQLNNSALLGFFNKNGLYVYSDHELEGLDSSFLKFNNEKRYLGTLTRNRFEAALKYTKIFLTKNNQQGSDTFYQWMTLIAISCGAAAISLDPIDSNDIRYELLNDQENPREFSKAILSDKLFRGKKALTLRRKIFLKHTFSHRFQTICRQIGINHDWCEYPLASITTTTYRPHCLENAIENFKKQTYPNKELIMVFNSDDIDIERIRRRYDHDKNIKFFHTPREMSNGEALNVGFSAAMGEYIFKMDDDDYYGENYILDMMLSTRAVQFDFMGKRVPFFYLENENKTYERRMRRPDYLVRNIADLDSSTAWIGGNTFCCRKDFFKSHKFSSKNIAAADSEFQLNFDPQKYKIGITDRFNVLISRSAVSSHTWRVQKMDFRGKFICEGVGEKNVFI
ncbi:MAG: glycosyltransferase [Desulfobacula sp.]|nr:glycosyltransferase [Desulfobacula sp.]